MRHTDLAQVLVKHRQPTIWLPNHTCYMRCRHKGSVKYYPFRILGYVRRPFTGQHLVSYGNHPPVWVQSLTAFKMRFFPNDDLLAFERATLVCIDNHLYTLKSVRSICALPKYHIDDIAVIYSSPSTYYRINLHPRKKPYTLHQRTVSFMRNSVSALLTSYARDLRCGLEEAAKVVRKDICRHLDFIVNTHGQLVDEEFEAAMQIIAERGLLIDDEDNDDGGDIKNVTEDGDVDSVLDISEELAEELIAIIEGTNEVPDQVSSGSAPDSGPEAR